MRRDRNVAQAFGAAEARRVREAAAREAEALVAKARRDAEALRTEGNAAAARTLASRTLVVAPMVAFAAIVGFASLVAAWAVRRRAKTGSGGGGRAAGPYTPVKEEGRRQRRADAGLE